MTGFASVALWPAASDHELALRGLCSHEGELPMFGPSRRLTYGRAVMPGADVSR